MSSPGKHKAKKASKGESERVSRVSDYLTDQTKAEYAEMLEAGCEAMTPAELECRVTALGYRLERTASGNATGAYVNSSNGRTYRAFGVTFSTVATGDTYGRVGRRVSFANVDAPRDRIAELQELRRNSAILSAGRVWEL